MSIKKEIIDLVTYSIKNLQSVGQFSDFEIPEFSVEYPKEKTHGDYSTSVALQLAKIVNKKPIEIASLLAKQLNGLSGEIFEKVEMVQPGFINFFLKKEYLQKQVREILKQKENFGSQKIHPVKSAEGGLAKREFNRVNVEFISANPTGPLTLGNGRGGFCGDVLTNVLNKAGYKVTREYYINDRGEQIIKLGHSVLGDSEAVYKGEYIDKLKNEVYPVKSAEGGVLPKAKQFNRVKGNDPEQVGEGAAKIILEKMIKPTIKRMGIKFDVWFSEKSLYENKSVDETIEDLKKRGVTYESEGAVWFKCQELEDDKDRVLIRKDGIRTYFASDIAYLKNKIDRGFEKIILFLGADHYGYVARLKAAAHVLGFNKENLDAIVMQMVRLFQDGKEVRMSKRTGTYVTLDELFDEVSLDVARFFFLTRSANTHLNFDLNLAKEQSQKNPVYYVQYGHARICSILRKCWNFKFLIFNFQSNSNFQLLKEKSELDLIKQLIKLPEVIEETAKDYQVQRLPQYATELADAFHRFYEKCRVIDKDKNLTSARLGLIKATKIVLKNVLDLMGISSPKKM